MVSLEEIKMFTIHAHEGQVRKYTGEPYVEHCFAVAENVFISMKEPTPDLVFSAYLHDTVEDTDVTQEEIQQKFGDKVAEYVWYLTKPPEFVGNREQRKTLDRARLAAAPPELRMVKICDLMHNAPSIKEHDKTFWKTWKTEAIQLLEVMEARYVWDSLCTDQARDDYAKLVTLLTTK
jgi:(p)ppGpp synthase/HD superfamily hydrolase